MKYNSRLIALLLGVSVLFSACEDNVEPIFFVNVQRDFRVETGLNTIVTHVFELKNVPMLYNENLDVNNRVNNDVGEVNPADAKLSTVFNTVDWSLFDRVEVYIISRVDKTKRVRMFYSNSPDFNSRSELTLFNSFVNIKDYVSEGLVDLELQLRTRAFVPGNFEARFNFSYAVFDQI